jgi:plasmid maintenance system antidote protein VapI
MDEIKSREWTVEYFAQRLEYDLDFTKKLVAGEVDVTTILAEKIGKVFGTGTELWVNLQNSYNRN